jgi:hypothetical protein
MPSTRRIIPWTRKPPLGYGVNWSHPLANGLLAFLACNEGGGAPVDLCYGLNLAPNAAGNGTWGQDKNGRVYTTNSAGIGATVAAPSYLQIQPPMTLVWSGNLLGTPSNQTPIFGVTYTNAFTNPYHGYILIGSIAPSYLLAFTYNTGSGNYTTVSSGTLSYGPFWLAGTITSSAQALYVNNPWVAAATKAQAITTIAYASPELVVGTATFQSAYSSSSSHSYGLIYNRILTSAELNQLYTYGPWGMIDPVQGCWLKQLSTSPYTFSASGLAISGGYGGTTFPIASPAAGLAISGAYGGTTFPIASPAAGLAISGTPGTSTAGPSPRVAGLAISGGMGGAAETVTVLLAGLRLSGAPGGATGGGFLGPFYLPYEYTSVVIETGNANPFGIDPERTTVITVGLTSSD